MFNKFIFIFLFYISFIFTTINALPTTNFKNMKRHITKMKTTDMPHQPAVPPILEKDIIHPTQSLLEIVNKSSTLSPHNIQTQLLSHVSNETIKKK